MTGYLEALTDPSYYGQIVIQTFPLIGNYGVIPEDFESDRPYLKAYVVRQWCQEPSNFRSKGDLDSFLYEHGIPGICDIDTRALTRIVREYGVMNAKITLEPPSLDEIIPELRSYRVLNAVSSVCGKERTVSRSPGSSLRVVLWNFGAKGNIERMLLKRGCEVVTVPFSATADEIIALAPDGVVISNGPGDPAENTGAIAEIAKLVSARIPAFGICLGHQLLALSQGAGTEKLKYGHRGANQPVLDRETGRIYITSQNHGYAVVSSTLPAHALESHVNVNDGTCEGIKYSGIPAFSVQFHPEACGGPLDTSFMFDDFADMMRARTGKEAKPDAASE
jgi:carbamoyl-phosphate synthase small subunit